MESSPLQQIVNLIRKSEDILILTHANPDGDAVGSALGLLLTLRKLDKKVAAAAGDPTPGILRFLPALENLETSIAGANDLVISLPVGESEASLSTKVEDGMLKIFVRSSGKPLDSSEIKFGVGEADYDLIICVDTPDLPQLGKLFATNPNLFYDIPVINIDHHPSNSGFGQVSLVDTTAASASEVVLRVIRSLESEYNQKLLDSDIATLILTGVITDTGSFQNANTTPRSFEISADLIEAGGRQQEIIQHVYKTKQLSTLKLWGKVLSKIEFDPIHRIVWSSANSADFNESAATDEDAAGIIDELLTNAPGAEIVVLFRELIEGGVKASIRTTTPAVSASELAAQFGGGGHLRAAGFRILDAKLDEGIEKAITYFKNFQAERLHLIQETKAKMEEKPAAKVAKKPVTKRKPLSERVEEKK
ncbi:MAG: DHH family phosphoesterase [Candidatus Gracilibacteria bacterium]|nr:DHH family phosphoesterase [Candidatus Gracilibacteria bacterium]MDD5179316.1 DHH family phosphoesterase [Candidatus Gracilibacteria bacterium]